ncbi:hypothetical protein, partial [Serratia ureilytica]|uniref:hypothetical protein n=1 Tax=Serratia ureilytica TaxID=300181 RepID=UPI003FA74074
VAFITFFLFNHIAVGFVGNIESMFFRIPLTFTFFSYHRKEKAFLMNNNIKVKQQVWRYPTSITYS